MAKNARQAAIKAAQAKKIAEQGTASTLQPEAPDLPIGTLNDAENASIDARLTASTLLEQLDTAGISIQDFAEKEFGIKQSGDKEESTAATTFREIKTPSGNIYQAVLTHLSYEELVEKTVIDERNVREPEERTQEALAQIIDEIGLGCQLYPAIVHIREDQKISFDDGSCRRAAAIFAKVGLKVEVLDRQPTPEDLDWMIGASDKSKEFPFFTRGRLYHNIMTNKGWNQITLSKERSYSKADISRCVKFFNHVEPYLKPFLTVTSFTKTQVEVLNRDFGVIEKYNQVEEFLKTLVEGTCDNKTVLANISSFAKKLLKPYSKPKAEPQVLYEEGKTKVSFIKSSKTKAKLELNYLPEDLEQKILALIEEELKNSPGEQV